MTLKYLLYSLLFLTGVGNSLHSTPVDGPAPRVCDGGLGSDGRAWIDKAGIFDLFDEYFPLIVEEDSSEGNDDESNDGPFFDADTTTPGFITTHTVVSPLLSQAPPRALFCGVHDDPLYLLHQVFRI